MVHILPWITRVGIVAGRSKIHLGPHADMSTVKVLDDGSSKHQKPSLLGWPDSFGRHCFSIVARSIVAGCAALLSFQVSSPAMAQIAAHPAPNCGKILTSTRICSGKNCRNQQTFQVNDAWHGLSQCMRNLRDIWSKSGPDAAVSAGDQRTIPVSQLVKSQILKEMQSSRVGYAFAGHSGPPASYSQAFADRLLPRQSLARVSLLNERKVPYNAMGQTGLAYFLVQMAGLADKSGLSDDAAFYRSLANGSIGTVLAPIANGGLSTVSNCAGGNEKCRWIHSVTRKDDPSPVSGATLNQHLHAVRDLGMIADMRKKQGQNSVDLEQSIDEGIAQLFLSDGHEREGQAPNLADFVAPATGRKGLHWAYYGFNPTAIPPKGGYFLGGGRDCSYHRHSLELISAILQRAQTLGRAGNAIKSARQCNGALHRIYQTAVAGKIDIDDLPPADRSGTNAAKSCAAKPGWAKRIRYLTALFKNC